MNSAVYDDAIWPALAQAIKSRLVGLPNPDDFRVIELSLRVMQQAPAEDLSGSWASPLTEDLINKFELGFVYGVEYIYPVWVHRAADALARLRQDEQEVEFNVEDRLGIAGSQAGFQWAMSCDDATRAAFSVGAETRNARRQPSCKKA